jgi:hypothetical protein
MSVLRRYAARRAAGFVDPKKILRRNDPRDGADFRNLGATRRRPTRGTERKEPNLAPRLNRQSRGALRCLRLRKSGKILYSPIKRSRRQVGDFLFGKLLDDKLLLRRCSTYKKYGRKSHEQKPQV